MPGRRCTPRDGDLGLYANWEPPSPTANSRTLKGADQESALSQVKLDYVAACTTATALTDLLAIVAGGLSHASWGEQFPTLV